VSRFCNSSRQTSHCHRSGDQRRQTVVWWPVRTYEAVVLHLKVAPVDSFLSGIEDSARRGYLSEFPCNNEAILCGDTVRVLASGENMSLVKVHEPDEQNKTCG
jgi:hypothetical protein